MGSLENLDGERVDEGAIEGDGWRADCSSAPVPAGPSYRLTEVTIRWSGTHDRLEPVIFQFRSKAFRAPG